MKGTLLSAIIENITTRKDNTIKIVLGSQELTPQRAGELFQLHNKLAVVYVSPQEIGQGEIDTVDSIDPDLPGKTQSQRLRGVLYKMWEHKKEGYEKFDAYYRYKMETIIDHYKKQLP